jgi:hypothetical protein
MLLASCPFLCLFLYTQWTISCILQLNPIRVCVRAQVLGVAHLLVSLGIVLAADKYLKQAFVAASIKFPSALFGMFCVFSVLVVLDTFVPALAKAFMDFFEPATVFIQRWLPLFYVPSLVVLPLAVKDIPAASGLKIFFITCMYHFSRSFLSISLVTSLYGSTTY